MDYSGEAWREHPPSAEEEEDERDEEGEEGGDRSFELSMFTLEY